VEVKKKKKHQANGTTIYAQLLLQTKMIYKHVLARHILAVCGLSNQKKH